MALTATNAHLTTTAAIKVLEQNASDQIIKANKKTQHFVMSRVNAGRQIENPVRVREHIHAHTQTTI